MNLSAIDLRLLRSLVELSRAPSFVRAAEKLHISQPALSQHMSDLSAAMGIPLFEKVGRRSVLTDAGRSFANSVVLALECLEDTLVEHSSAQNKVSGNLRIAATNTYLNALAIPVAATLANEHTGLRISLREMPAHEILRALEEGSVDLGISPRVGVRKTLSAEHLFKEPFGLIGPTHLIKGLGKASRLGNIVSQPLVLLNKDYLMRQQIDRQARLENISLNLRLEVSGAQHMISALRQGDWISIGSALSTLYEPEFRFHPLRGTHLSREAVIYQRSRTSPTRAMTLFKEAMTAHTSRLKKQLAPKRYGIT
jgi:LysR family transcriptional regulator, cyn operon transcriptional activator